MGIALACDRICLSSPCFESSGEGLAVRPAGGSTFSATMKSSMFMGSVVGIFCSEFFRNWAIPLGLGVFCVGELAL